MANNDKVANKVCLIVIDGWGVSSEPYGEWKRPISCCRLPMNSVTMCCVAGNAILAAKTPVMDELCSGE